MPNSYKDVYIIIFVCISLLFGEIYAGNSKRIRQQDKVWKTRKKTCETVHCVHLIPDEAYNCVNNCTSNICYDQVYGFHNGGPLEDGEIDDPRTKSFMNCVRKEAKERYRRENTARVR